jgi:glutamate synthase (NADPH/NADH) small chain
MRLGAESVKIIYRRSMQEIPARREEVLHAEEEGIEFCLLQEPTEYLADEQGRVNKIKLIKMELGEPDKSGRRRPVAVKGSEYFIDSDLVIVSIGVSPNPLISMHLPELKTTSWGTIEVADNYMRANLEGNLCGW